MANEQNLRPCEYKFTQEDSKKGQAVAAANRRARKTLKEELQILLSMGDTQAKMSLALIEKAKNGDTRAFEVIRDTIGEKPKDEVALGSDGGIAVNIKIQE